jgi:hypothetical protein
VAAAAAGAAGDARRRPAAEAGFFAVIVAACCIPRSGLPDPGVGTDAARARGRCAFSLLLLPLVVVADVAARLAGGPGAAAVVAGDSWRTTDRRFREAAVAGCLGGRAAADAAAAAVAAATAATAFPRGTRGVQEKASWKSRIAAWPV